MDYLNKQKASLKKIYRLTENYFLNDPADLEKNQTGILKLMINSNLKFSGWINSNLDNLKREL